MGKPKYRKILPKPSPPEDVKDTSKVVGGNYLDKIWSKSVPETPTPDTTDSNGTIKRKPPRFTNVLDTPTLQGTKFKTNLSTKMKSTETKRESKLSKMAQFFRGKNVSRKRTGKYVMLQTGDSLISSPKPGMKRQKSELEFTFGPNKMISMKKLECLDPPQDNAIGASGLIEETKGSLLFRPLVAPKKDLVKQAKGLVQEIMADVESELDEEKEYIEVDDSGTKYIESKIQELKSKLGELKEIHENKIQVLSQQIAKLETMEAYFIPLPRETLI